MFELDHDRKPDLLYTVPSVGLGEAAETDVVPDHRVVTDIETVPGRRQVREWRQPLSALREVSLGVSKESKLLVVVCTGRMVKSGISCHRHAPSHFLGPLLVGCQFVRGHRPAGAAPSGTRGGHTPVLAHQLASARDGFGERGSCRAQIS